MIMHFRGLRLLSTLLLLLIAGLSPSTSWGQLIDPTQVGSAFPNINNTYYIDGVKYTTIQSAITAAGTTGAVIIPSSYAGSDTYTNPNNLVILDFRPQNANSFTTGSLGLWHGIHAAPSVTNLPGGNDLPVSASGPGSVIIQAQKAATTTTQTLSIGANSSVLVGSTTALGTNSSAPLIVGRGTANQELVPGGSWSIVDSIHLSITCANSHSGTTDIEQVGNVAFDGNSITFLNYQAPSQNTGAPIPLYDSNLVPFMYLPRNTEQGGNIEQNIIFPTGMNLVFMSTTNLPPTSYSELGLSTSTPGAIWNLNASLTPLGFIGPFISANPNPATAGIVQFASSDNAIDWRNNANTGNIELFKNTADELNVSGFTGLVLKTYIVSALPAAATAGAGAVVIVTDANSYSVGTCTGGGGDTMIAVSNGTAWSCH